MPARDGQAEKLRTALLDQLRHLIREAEALGPLVGRVPEALQEGRPLPEEPSIKEQFGLLAARDRQVHRPRLQQIADQGDQDAPRFEAVDEEALLRRADWNARPLRAILREVQTAREALIEAFAALPAEAWRRTGRFETAEGAEERDLYEMARRICVRDARRLREVGYRLYDSDFGTMSNVQ